MGGGGRGRNYFHRSNFCDEEVSGKLEKGLTMTVLEFNFTKLNLTYRHHFDENLQIEKKCGHCCGNARYKCRDERRAGERKYWTKESVEKFNINSDCFSLLQSVNQ